MYLLEVEPLDLGEDVKAVGLELIEPQDREPVRGAEAAQIWSRVLAAVSATEPWALDFFSHLERVREYCGRHGITYRETGKCMVIGAPQGDALAAMLERFEGETFGVRSGGPLTAGDAALEGDLARRGVDAYHQTYPNYFFCGVCDFENGFLTLLTRRLWASEVIRRVAPLLKDLAVEARIPR
ncbi:MAG: hypothetical protein HYR59_01405 [Acidobacteria bacterium]|nr:hypothetical protein [Acidobacteriota bacterium]